MDSLFLSSPVSVRVVRDRSLFSGGGRLLILGGRVTIFLTQILGGTFFSIWI